VDEWLDEWLHDGGHRIDSFRADEAALPVWRELLRDEDPEICTTAFLTMANHGEAAKDYLPDLVGFLVNDRNSDLAIGGGVANPFTVMGLHEKHGNALVPHLCKWLDDDDPTTIKRVIRALALCGEGSAPAIPHLMRKIHEEKGAPFVIVLAEIGAQALPALTEALKVGTVHARRNASSAVAAMRAEPMARATLLRQLAKDRDGMVRSNVLDGLHRIAKEHNEPEIVAAIIGMTADSEASIRLGAIDKLGDLQSTAALPRLKELSHSNASVEIRARAAIAIAKITSRN
jgi:HEAT repeat protein